MVNGPTTRTVVCARFQKQKASVSVQLHYIVGSG